jgi:hypothetical protein
MTGIQDQDVQISNQQYVNSEVVIVGAGISGKQQHDIQERLTL